MFEEVKNMTDEELQEYIRKDYEGYFDKEDNTEYLFAVLEEVTKRREAAGVVIRPTEEAWAEFVRFYMPREDAVAIAGESLQESLRVPDTLNPNLGGRKCFGNGKWLGYQRQCDNCDWYTTICFPGRPHIPQERVEFIIRNSVVNARFEGQECTAEDVAAIRRIRSGETTLEAELEALDAKCRAEGLRPALHGEGCPGNDIECPDCDWFTTICFPDEE